MRIQGEQGTHGRGRPPLARARASIARHPFASRARGAASAAGGAAGQPAGPSPVGVNPYDYSNDPLLQRIRAAGAQRIGEGEAEALRQRKQALIDYGDADLARQLGMDESTIQAAQANANSFMAGQLRAEHDQPIALDNRLQGGNLFYSGTRGVDQSRLAQSLLAARQAGQQRVRGGLAEIDQTLAGIRGDVNQQNLSAEQDAADRLAQQLGELPMGGGQGGQGGGGGGAPGWMGGIRPMPNGNRLRQMLRPRAPHAIPHLPGRRP